MKSKKNKAVILALYKILAANKEIVAWDYPPRPWKKAVMAILAFLKEKGIEAERTVAEWPHFTVEYVPTLNAEQRHKIKLLSPLFSTRIKSGNIEILEGRRFPVYFITLGLEFDDKEGILELKKHIQEITGAKPEFEEFSPHVSLVTVPKKYGEELKAVESELNEVIKKHKTAYKPDQLQFWKEMNIYELEEMAFK